MTKEIPSINELKKEFGTPKNVNVVHRDTLSPIEKLAVFVTEKIGTMGFFFIIFSWTVLWLGFNMFGPQNLRFDPAPAFVLW